MARTGFDYRRLMREQDCIQLGEMPTKVFIHHRGNGWVVVKGP